MSSSSSIRLGALMKSGKDLIHSLSKDYCNVFFGRRHLRREFDTITDENISGSNQCLSSRFSSLTRNEEDVDYLHLLV